MSTCPTSELHTLYLDKEMPQAYLAEYEEHIKSCEKCQKELGKLKKLNALFAEDAADITPSKDFLDQSYERLMVKMNYSKTTKKAPSFASRSFKYVIPVVAAAAVFAFAVPVGINALRGGSVKTLTATSSIYSQVPSQVSSQISNVALASEKGMIISGNLTQPVIPYSSFETTAENSYVSTVSNTANSETKLIKEVDVFRPTFEGEIPSGEKTISIRITIPGSDNVPVTAEIAVPLDVTGQ